jgi:2-desacetyl-2-hydroxyethyl bacteriochlorophyllide A dehydrogenase
MSSTQAFRAVRIRAPGRVSIEQFEPPQPAGDQVRVRLEGCGVCASNLPVWEGRPWFSYPMQCGAPGHEGWGTIDAIGSDIQGFKVGERVAFLSERAYAESDVTTADTLVKLPPELNGQPFPGEPLACALNIFRRAQIEAGQSVAIVGVGFLGAILTALAVRAGARVVALSRRPFALQLAERFGASAALGLTDPANALREARRLSADAGYERVIECVGSQEALDVASELAGTRARLVIAGYHQDGERRINLQQWNWRGLDVINAHERQPQEYVRGMQEAIALVVAGELNLQALLTHQFPLEEASAAFDVLAQRPEGFVKALVLCQ